MLNLPGSTPAKDLAMFKKIYSDSRWRPDMIKIYPCVVTKNSGLYKLWRAKKYKPYSGKQLIDLLIKIKKITPPYVRIARLIRDIPEGSIVAGNKITNLRQLIGERSQKEGWHCKCLRCREAGHNINSKFKIQNSKLNTLKYKANGGTEYFLSYESKNGKVLYGFLRLRINQDIKNNFMEELRGAAIIRELHTYGPLASIGEKGEVQHLGLGKKLLKTAEKICRENRLKKIAVISGIGVRKYYEKFGYRLKGNYMIKNL
ncbi:GNAT family N-acetyltransferase [Candidatus Falkowbacteria bacterium]|nr:GNAT family N-acetyltransferase [Candidatus Falkowbacteria bacterium]